MKQIMYVFKNGRLVGMQDVTDWPVRSIDKSIQALAMVGRTGEVSAKGRGICCSCGADIGEREIPAGTISHGYCPACYDAALKDTEKGIEAMQFQPSN